MAHVLTIIGRVPSKKNSKQIVYVKGRPLIISSADFKKWQRQATEQLASQVQPGVKLFNGMVAMKLFAPDRRASDLTNKAESVMDLLVDCGHLEDDNWFVVPEVRLSFGGVDKENPRVEIHDSEI